MAGNPKRRKEMALQMQRFTASLPPENHRQPPPTAEEDRRSMEVLASLSGDTFTATKILREQFSIEMQPVWLESMRNGRCRAMYEGFREEVSSHLEEALIAVSREIAGRALSLERRMLDETEKALAEGKITDPARAAANISKVKQTAVDKLLALTGRPTQITESRDALEIIRQLEAKRVLVPLEEVNGTAEDMP